MKQKMMGWHWHQLDHLQVICTSLQTDNHASTSSLNFLQDSALEFSIAHIIKCRTNVVFTYLLLGFQTTTRNVGQCKNNVMAALPNIDGALCSTPQSLADAHYYSAVQ